MVVLRVVKTNLVVTFICFDGFFAGSEKFNWTEREFAGLDEVSKPLQSGQLVAFKVCHKTED